MKYKNTMGREHSNKATINANTISKYNEQKENPPSNKRNISETFVAAKTKINIKAGGRVRGRWFANVPELWCSCYIIDMY